MNPWVRALIWSFATEAVLLCLCYVWPGGGHSPLFLTQIPALWLVETVAPGVGSCISCSWPGWALGGVGESLLIWLAILLVRQLLLASRRV